MEYTTLNNGIKMPMAGIGTFLLSPDEAENSVLSALKEGYRLIDTVLLRFCMQGSYAECTIRRKWMHSGTYWNQQKTG